jgi:hypothetical protein
MLQKYGKVKKLEEEGKKYMKVHPQRNCEQIKFRECRLP